MTGGGDFTLIIIIIIIGKVFCCGIILKTANLFATVISMASYHYLFIIIIAITIGHGIIILIVLGIIATFRG